MRPKLLYKNSLAVAAMALAFLLVANSAFAQGSSFTYQGRLTDGGAAANGIYDLQFVLFDSASSGAQIGSTQTLNSVLVSAGVFSVTLDFGANSFNGANRFLEISARLSGAGSFTLLTPRQQVTATPYAIRSVNASAADALSSTCAGCVQDTQINSVSGNKVSGTVASATNATQLGGIAASQYVQTSDSRLSDARPPTAGSSNYIQTNPSSAQNATFNISGNGTVGGTLSGNIVNAATQYNLGGARILGTFGTKSLFAGPRAGENNASNGTENAFFGDSAGLNNTTGRRNTFVGQSAGQTTRTGESNTIIGFASDVTSEDVSFATAIGAFARVSRSNSLVLGSDIPINNLPFNVGIGTGAPSKTLEVRTSAVGDGINLFGTAPAFFLSDAGNNEKAALAFAGSAGLYSTDAAAGDIVLRTNSGRLLLQHGTGGAGLILNLSGTVSVPNFGSGGTATVCRNSVNAGELAFCSSSLRYKSNVQTFLGGLDIINRLRPISFKWKQDGAKDIGLGAEEVEKVEPLLTFRNANGEIEGVKYNQLSAVFVNAFKEQQTEIQQQQARNAEQQRQINQQQVEIAKLDARLRAIERTLRKRSTRR